MHQWKPDLPPSEALLEQPKQPGLVFFNAKEYVYFHRKEFRRIAVQVFSMLPPFY